jgi:hypothetical protein
MVKLFFANNKVLLFGIGAALLLVAQQAQAAGPINPPTLALAGLVAVLGVLANSWKGKTASVVGIFGSVAGALGTMLSDHAFNWSAFVMSAMVAVLGFLATGLQGGAAASSTTQMSNTTVETKPAPIATSEKTIS